MVDDFAHILNESCLNSGHDCISSDASDDLSSFKELLFGTQDMQEPQGVVGSGTRLMGRPSKVCPQLDLFGTKCGG